MRWSEACGVGLVVLAGCAAKPDASSPCPERGSRLVVTADWLNRSLTLLDYGRVTSPACSESEAIAGTVDLGAYAPGPLELALTPDGKRAIVSVGVGSFAALGLSGGEPVPAGGALLVVDLAQKKVLFEVTTPSLAEGVAVAPDGKTAFSANYGTDAQAGHTVSKIDLASGKSLVDFDVGASPKQVALRDDGVAMVSLAGDKGVRLFRADDPAGSLGPLAVTASDPSGVVFVGAGSAAVANAVDRSVTVLDLAGTTAKVRATTPVKKVPYGLALVPGTTKVLITGVLATTELLLFDTATAAAEPIPLDAAGFPISVAVDREGAFAFVAHARDRALSVVDLQRREVRTLHWLAHAGPTYVAVQ